MWWVVLIAGVGLIWGCNGPSADESETVATAAGVGEMVTLPGGWFEMGSSDEDEPDQTIHKVWVSSFVMDKHLVTQSEYEKLMGKNPSHWKGPDHPVDQIRWADAAAYCNARSRAEGLDPAYDLKTGQCDFEADGYRLPTEAEYEYALRAGSDTAYFHGDSPGDLSRYAWFKENSPRGTHPVGQKPANAWGLCDMIGNVWEWCNDYYHVEYYQQSPERDPRGPASGENRVVRGGCWNSRPEHCRSAYRNYEMPAYTDICFAKDINGQIGFRCVRKVK
jgi:formylglycine-generating enzyme required for sulfatase activity